MIKLVLGNQYVEHCDSTYKVMLGSGMGLHHSRELCDANLLVLGEDIVLRATPPTLQNYSRFRGDVLIVCRNTH